MTIPTVEVRRRLFLLAEQNAKKVLKPGDRIRVTKCPGTKRWVTFARWDGHWIVSKSGRSEYSPGTVDMLNGKPVDFKVEQAAVAAPSLCKCGYPMPCAKTVPVTLCRA